MEAESDPVGLAAARQRRGPFIREATDLDLEQWEGARAQETPSFSSEAFELRLGVHADQAVDFLAPWKIKTIGIAEIRSPRGLPVLVGVHLADLDLAFRTPRRVFQSSALAYGRDHTKELKSTITGTSDSRTSDFQVASGEIQHIPGHWYRLVPRSNVKSGGRRT